MQPIAEWLVKIGLERYAPAFADNDIDVSVLPHLTDADLEKIGVSLGHRRKMLVAIAELSNSAQAPQQSTLTRSKPEDAAERRQVTVMFSDLVGSTALSARMDPEDLREIISAYQKCVAETVQRFGGFVAKYMGDGVLVYFGYPQAHEDDAERAVRAGLELIAAVSALKTRALPADARRHRDRARGRRRPDRVGCGSGTGDRRRDAEPCGALAGHCGAEHVVIAESTRKLARQSLRACKTSAHKTSRASQGPVRAWAGIATGFSRKPLRGSARERTDRACRSGRRTRTAASALVKGKDGRRPSGVALR